MIRQLRLLYRCAMLQREPALLYGFRSASKRRAKMEGRQREEFLLRVKLIGSIEAADSSGNNVLPPSRKSRALLSYLALNAGQWVPRSRITRLLWDRVPEAQGRASLRQALHELSTAMGPAFTTVVATERERLRFNSEAAWVDALVVATPAAEQVPIDLNVFSGSLLLDGLDKLGDEFDHWLTLERQKLEERIRRWSESNVRSGTAGALKQEDRVEIARKAVALDPTNENAVRELMRTLAAAGQRAQAVLEYERCRALLRSRLDIEPAPETQRLHRDLRRETGPEGALAEPRPAAPDLRERIHLLREETRAHLHIHAADQSGVGNDVKRQSARWADLANEISAKVLPQIDPNARIDARGEGLSLQFSNARSAAAAALAIQERSQGRERRASRARQLRLRMGIDIGGGEVQRSDEETANTARLVSALAGAGETVITAGVRDRLAPVLDADVEDLGDCVWAGIPDTVRAYRISAPPAHGIAPVVASDRTLSYDCGHPVHGSLVPSRPRCRGRGLGGRPDPSAVAFPKPRFDLTALNDCVPRPCDPGCADRPAS